MNSDCCPASGTDSHLDGYCLSHEAQRKGAIDYLKRVKEIMGWNTCWIVEALKSQWSDLDEFVKKPLKVT